MLKMIRQFTVYTLKKGNVIFAFSLSAFVLLFLVLFALQSATSKPHVPDNDFSSVKIPPYDLDSTIYQVEVDKSDFVPNIVPVDMTGGRVSGEFGMRIHPIYGGRRMHCGIDLVADTGAPVTASADGQVEFAARRGGYGNLVIIDHLNQFKTRYAHLSEIKVTKGDYVKRRDIVGLVGETGVVTGPHLHYEVRILDEDHPMKGLERDPREFLPKDFDKKPANDENDSPGLGSE